MKRKTTTTSMYDVRCNVTMTTLKVTLDFQPTLERHANNFQKKKTWKFLNVTEIQFIWVQLTCSSIFFKHFSW